MIEIAGLAVSMIGLAADLAGKIRGWADWEESVLLVDDAWLKIAIDESILDGELSDYSWSREDRVATRELKETHGVVLAVNEETRTKYRLVRGREGDRLVLMRRLTG